MKIKKIPIPIYHGNLIIIISEDYPAVIDKFKIKTDFDISHYGAFTEARVDKNGIAEYIICIDQNVENHLIAHECVHLVNAVFVHVGQQLDRHNDEAQAYLTGWFFKEIEKFLIKNL